MTETKPIPKSTETSQPQTPIPSPRESSERLAVVPQSPDLGRENPGYVAFLKAFEQ